MSSHIHHAHSHNLIIAQRLGKRNHYSNKCDCLLTHSEYCPENAEKQHHKHDHDITYTKLANKRKTLQRANL